MSFTHPTIALLIVWVIVLGFDVVGSTVVAGRTMRAIEECRDEYWLVPIGAEAFSVPSAYWPDGPKEVFPEEFRRAFFQRYRHTETTPYFDVWECR
jgi:hypothetical protein